LSVRFQRIGGKLDAFAAKMQPLEAKNRGKIGIFLADRQKMPVIPRLGDRPDLPRNLPKA